MPPTHTFDPLYLSFQLALAGRYSIDREIGRGGMGVVYLATEVDLDRPVAIKLLPPERARDPDVRERFVREARLAASLSHPNIIPIHAVDEIGEFVFYVMAYIDGETVADRVAHRGPMSASEGTRVLRDVALALAHAHEHGVVHRDVKPDNILLERATGRVLVADFGIAAATHGAAGDVVGTPEFMSPEQALGKPLDGRSDVYALGVSAFYALSGRLPFEGTTSTEILAKHVTHPAAPLRTMGTSVSRRVATLVDQCLAKAPDRRPQSARLVAERLTVALDQKRELPAALQTFVREHGRLGSGGALLAQLALLGAGGAIAALTASETAGFVAIAAGYVAGPIAVLMRGALRLLRSGYRQTDLPGAFQAELDRAREERNVVRGGVTTGLDHVLDRTTTIALRIAVPSFVVLSLISVWSFSVWSYSNNAFRDYAFRGWFGAVALVGAAALAAFVASGVLTVAGLDVARRRRQSAESAVGEETPALDGGISEPSGIERFLARARRTSSRIGIGAAVASRAGGLAVEIWLLGATHYAFRLTSTSAVALFMISSLIDVGFLTAGAARAWRFLRHLSPGDLDTRFWATLWTGPLGRWVFRVAERLTPAGMLHSAMTHRPTELSLGMAAESLYAALPVAVRADLSAVPATIAQLQHDAQRLRPLLDQLDETLSESCDDTTPAYQELRRNHDHIQAKLSDVVGALETLRLNLLRLHAGTGSVGGCTTHIGLADQVSADVERLFPARPGTNRMRRGLSSGPIPTPA